jgi:hypothetical protein
MFIHQVTQRRVNIYAPYAGFSKLDTPEIRQRAGVIEIADPVPPDDYSDETYYRTEQDAAPYVVFTKKSDEQLAELAKSKARSAIESKEREALMPRATREFMLTFMELNLTPEQLALNHGYVKVKAFDEEVKALRAAL